MPGNLNHRMVSKTSCTEIGQEYALVFIMVSKSPCRLMKSPPTAILHCSEAYRTKRAPSPLCSLLPC